MAETLFTNGGHGHVFPRPDGHRARCGGPPLCSECARDLARKQAADPSPQQSTADPVSQKALANLLDAVEGVLWFSWADSDLDEDAARSLDRLRLARDEYGVVQRIKNG